jgi:hypothetical protein
MIGALKLHRHSLWVDAESDRENDRWRVGEARDDSQIRRSRVTKRAIEKYDGMEEEHRYEPQPNQQRRNQKTRRRKRS